MADQPSNVDSPPSEQPESPDIGIVVEDIELTRGQIIRTRLKLAWRSFRKNWSLFAENKIGIVGLGIIAIFGLMAIAHPILMATVWSDKKDIYDPVIGTDAVIVEKVVVVEVTDPETQLTLQEAQLEGELFASPGDIVEIPLAPAPPSRDHLLGTDPLGRDILSQLMFGARAAFTLGIVAALVTTVLATLVGSVAAYHGGLVDTWLMRQADLILLMPLLPLLIVVAAFYQVGLIGLALILGILGGLGGTAIILKSQALAVKVKPFIDAARVAGGSSRHIILRHVVPNVLPLSFLYMMFEVTAAILTEATLSFFGLLDIEMSWGIMINTAHTQGYTLSGLGTWWLLLPAGLAVTFMGFAFFLVGRAADEVVNPRLRAR
ncbi:MAG: ABC transporter permease [Acidimicrobiia bacterium]|nr:ABC transporter permease [Acidimicrobiia bacterium]